MLEFLKALKEVLFPDNTNLDDHIHYYGLITTYVLMTPKAIFSPEFSSELKIMYPTVCWPLSRTVNCSRFYLTSKIAS